MTDLSVKELRDAASRAHHRGDDESASVLFAKIVELFPDTTEAAEAVFFLSGFDRSPRPPARRAAARETTRPTKLAGSDEDARSVDA
jgi:hypothetical protein